MPGTSPRNHSIVLERRHKAATLYLQGEQQYEIARQLHVSQQQISFDLKAIRELWLTSLVRDFDAAKAQELAKIDSAEVEYWGAWRRSQSPAETTVTAQEEPGKRKVSIKREGQVGDPRFLDGVLRCIERRCALLGLDAPQRYVVNWDQLSDDQLERLAQGEAPQHVLAEA